MQSNFLRNTNLFRDSVVTIINLSSPVARKSRKHPIKSPFVIWLLHDSDDRYAEEEVLGLRGAGRWTIEAEDPHPQELPRRGDGGISSLCVRTRTPEPGWSGRLLSWRWEVEGRGGLEGLTWSYSKHDYSAPEDEGTKKLPICPGQKVSDGRNISRPYLRTFG